MHKLNLGCGRDIRPHPWLNIDVSPNVGADIVGDISDPRTFDSLADNSVDEIEMFHILEHIPNPLPMLEALYRVAKPDCKLSVRVPHGSCDMAFADPQHVRQFFPSSFQFFAQPAYKRADYGYRGDWDTDLIELLYDPNIPDDVPDEHLIKLTHISRNIVWELWATLHAVKPIRPVNLEWEYNPNMNYRKA